VFEMADGNTLRVLLFSHMADENTLSKFYTQKICIYAPLKCCFCFMSRKPWIIMIQLRRPLMWWKPIGKKLRLAIICPKGSAESIEIIPPVNIDIVECSTSKPVKLASVEIEYGECLHLLCRDNISVCGFFRCPILNVNLPLLITYNCIMNSYAT